MLGGTVNAQAQNGLVPFDYPDVPLVEFQFDLDRSTIALVMEDTAPHIVSLFNALVHLHLRNYKASHFDKILWYYGTNLKARGWSAFEKSANLHLYTLTQKRGRYRYLCGCQKWKGDVSDKYGRSVRAKTGQRTLRQS